MALTITALETSDVRFPTSELLDGSDAVNVEFTTGRSSEIRPETLRRHAFPRGAVWNGGAVAGR